MARLPPDPPWSWITHESGRISTSPLESVFPPRQQLVREPTSPVSKKQKLDITIGGPSLSKHSSKGEKSLGSLRQNSRHATSPYSRNETFPKGSRHEIGTADNLCRKDNLFPVRPPSATIKDEQRCLSEKSMSPMVQGSFSGTIVPFPIPRYSKDSSPTAIGRGAPRDANEHTVSADSSFWAGDQPEDILTELATKNGFCDRSTPPTSDLNTARPTVWSCLKHRSGLQVLSSLFVSTLRQRQSNSTIPSTGTFKPPPRVTLTDTKREAWLRDLADPVVPLRRLSRTIPHGIRGKALLDHCLSKTVPPWRAVWLTKCVGANEVRASKRKGSSNAITSSGETKWMEEWTQNVEQFLESLLVNGSDQSWRIEVVYALQLVSHFCSEQLLDQRHFVDWVTASFKSCKVDRIPIWLLVVQLHWKEIWRFRHCGKQLAEAILLHVSDVTKSATGVIFEPLLRELTGLLHITVNAFPDSYMLPTCWEICSIALKRQINHGHGSCIVEQLHHRNEDLSRSTGGAVCISKDVTRRRIISTLDTLADSINIKLISTRCHDAAKDSTTLVNTIFQWSSTPFRLNSNRLYLGVRLLRFWKDEGIEIDQPILDIIAANPTPSKFQAKSVCRIIIELVRSRHFSTSRYLQWLLAREHFLPSYPMDQPNPLPELKLSGSDFPQFDTLPFLVLRQLPLQGLPKHTLNLRISLLDRYGYSVWDETNRAATIREIVERNLPLVCSRGDSVPVDVDALEQLGMENRSLVAEASHFIRSAIKSRKRHQKAISKSCSQVLSASEFGFTRKFFERHEDYSMFADVMKLVADSSDLTLLQDVTSTLNWNLEVFQAIGAAEAIFWDLFARAEDATARGMTNLTFLLTLADLGERIPAPPPAQYFLRQEIRLCHPAPPIAACSPVADPDAELLEGPDTVFFEEMEMVLTSGNSIDRQALSRLFIIITTRVEKDWTHSSLSLGPLFELLHRLRQFDRQALDQLLTEWLKAVAATKLHLNLSRMVIPLVCSATMALPSVMDILVEVLPTLETNTCFYELGHQLLGLLMPTPEHHSISKYVDAKVDFRMYRWAAERDQLLRMESQSLPLLIRMVLDKKVHLHVQGECQACALVSQPSFSWLLHILIIYQPKVRKELEHYLASDTIHSSMDALIDRLLELSGPSGNEPPSNTFPTNVGLLRDDTTLQLDHRIKRLLDVVDDFNIALSRLSFIILLRQLKTRPRDDDYGRAIAMLLSATVSADDDKHEIILDLLSVLDSEHALEIHTRASLILFTSLSALIPGASSVDSGSGIPFGKLLSVIDVTEQRISDNEPTTIAKKLCDTVVAVRLVFQQNETGAAEKHSSPSFQWIVSTQFHSCIDVLLRLIVIHQSRFRNLRISETLISQLIIDLIIVLVQPNLLTQSALLSRLFDHIVLLSDELTPETRGICLHALRYQYSIHDPRIEHLLGFPGNISSGSLRLRCTTPHPRDRVKYTVPGASAGFDDCSAPFVLRRWEMVQDATPNASENDTTLNLSLFGTRKAMM